VAILSAGYWISKVQSGNPGQRLSPKTIVNYSLVVKLVVASAGNDADEQIHPRKWNDDSIGLPIVEKEKQHRPRVTETELGTIQTSMKERYAILFALLAGTGLRIGEAFGLKPTDLSPDCRALQVRRSSCHGQEQLPKTPNAVREVDIAEPLAQLLHGYVLVKSGYIFATGSGRPLIQRNVLGILHSTGKKVGSFAFRRFRAETLRRARVLEDLTKLWVGHSKQSETDYYASGLSKDVERRQEWCERVGLGFSLIGLQNVVAIDAVKLA
jgi:integrase